MPTHPPSGLQRDVVLAPMVLYDAGSHATDESREAVIGCNEPCVRHAMVVFTLLGQHRAPAQSYCRYSMHAMAFRRGSMLMPCGQPISLM